MAVNARRRVARGDSGPGGALQFLRETVDELRKVVWPTPQELYRYTMVVVTTVVIIAVFIGLVDLGLGKVVEKFVYSGVTSTK